MATKPHSIKLALEIMHTWLGLPQRTYKATVYLFARELPPDEVLEAVEIAVAKIPAGGREAFRYFCGVCHSKIKEQRIRLSWN
jgi:hypothetical protein